MARCGNSVCQKSRFVPRHLPDPSPCPLGQAILTTLPSLFKNQRLGTTFRQCPGPLANSVGIPFQGSAYRRRPSPVSSTGQALGQQASATGGRATSLFPETSAPATSAAARRPPPAATVPAALPAPLVHDDPSDFPTSCLSYSSFYPSLMRVSPWLWFRLRELGIGV